MHGKLLSAIFPRYVTDGLELQSDNESEDVNQEDSQEEEEEDMIPQHPHMVTGPAVVPPPLRAQAAMLASTTVTIDLPGAVNRDEDAPADVRDMTPERTRMTAVLLSQGLVGGAPWNGDRVAATAYPQRPDDDSAFDTTTTDDEMV